MPSAPLFGPDVQAASLSAAISPSALPTPPVPTRLPMSRVRGVEVSALFWSLLARRNRFGLVSEDIHAESEVL